MEIINPIYLPAKWRVERAFKTYPFYNPPHKYAESRMSKRQASENFDYFMDTRASRVHLLQLFFVRHFGSWRINLGAPDVAPKIDHWFNQFGAFLVDDAPSELAQSFISYAPLWTGRLAGLNAVWDLGTALGELAIQQNPKLHWAMGRSIRGEPRADSYHFQRPVLMGFPNPDLGPDIITFVYELSHGLRKRASIGHLFDSDPDRFSYETAIRDRLSKISRSARSGE